MHPAAQRAAPPKRRASYTAREKLDAANALEATKDVARVIKERYPDLSASAYESRRTLVLKWLCNKPKIEMQCSLKNGSSKKEARPTGVGIKLPLEIEKELVVWVNDLRKDGVPISTKMLALQFPVQGSPTCLLGRVFARTATGSQQWKQICTHSPRQGQGV
ncbi:hypothetical protein PC117_g7748 [Phytophthora cactorum]|uniref:HTH CENPB-type domain-containing protein n=1 Tax=Phytophthora cactorum TaxID=29920 RepID=A0A8T1E3T0_9STRA|nr:hypothetical protein PC117_g7748 [Phytophthora cactorum]